MRTLAVAVLALCAAEARADLSYDVRVTVVAHPILGMKTKESLAHVMLRGASAAVRQNDIVQIVEPERNLITLIDFRTKTYATGNLDEVRRADDQGFDSIAAGIRSKLVQSGRPCTWKGVAVKRDVARTTMTGGEAPGEIVVTSDWIEDVKAFEESKAAFEEADERHARDLDAAIQTLLLTHPERFADGLKIRKNAAGRGGFQIHSLAEMRLAEDAPMLKAIGPEYRDRPILSEETEVLRLDANPVDPAVFLVPSGFDKVDFSGLLEEMVARRHR